jgi:hypothetical protein
MSSTDSGTAPARPARWRALIALFGVAMFVLGVVIGGLGLPRLLALNPSVTPQASVVAQVPLATATVTVAATSVVIATPATATLVPPTATILPTATSAPTATAPPTATTAPPTATVAPTLTVAPTNPASAIFAPDPSATAATVATSPTAAAGTPTSEPTTTVTATATATASATGTPASTPTVTPTSDAFAATDQIFTELPVNFRAGPGTAFAAQTALPPGTLLEATGETTTVDGVVWRQFRLANGTIGWVRAMDVTAVR